MSSRRIEPRLGPLGTGSGPGPVSGRPGTGPGPFEPSATASDLRARPAPVQSATTRWPIAPFSISAKEWETTV